MKQRRWWIRLVWIAIAVGGLVLLLIYCAFSPNPAISSSELPARLETARFLYEQDVVFPVGPFVLIATPFQLVYGVITAALLILGLVICLTRCLFARYARHFHPPHVRPRKDNNSSGSGGYTGERYQF
jgi:hypothetical protein